MSGVAFRQIPPIGGRRCLYLLCIALSKDEQLMKISIKLLVIETDAPPSVDILKSLSDNEIVTADVDRRPLTVQTDWSLGNGVTLNMFQCSEVI